MLQVVDLPWPRFLFHDYTVQANSTLATSGKKLTDDHLCGCGCKQLHRNAVSRVVEEEESGIRSRRIVWYLSLTCRNKAMGLSQARHCQRR